MDWNVLRDEDELAQLLQKSESRPQVIFKHSNRCSISSVAKNRLERAGAPEGADFYFLDIFGYRSISNRVAEVFKIHHESPQVLVIKNRVCVYDESHMGINMDEIKDLVNGTT